MEDVPSNGELAQLGLARISYGPIPYVESMSKLREKARKLFS
ncbi:MULTISPECIES: isocitrate lyase/phosphoenolpyruvate mutase family protein [Bradyrhizobium]|nr:isocitrate lyase/phosphoenolpyruvate mutase family protein [Bradyrhizobium vignae]